MHDTANVCVCSIQASHCSGKKQTLSPTAQKKHASVVIQVRKNVLLTTNSFVVAASTRREVLAPASNVHTSGALHSRLQRSRKSCLRGNLHFISIRSIFLLAKLKS